MAEYRNRTSGEVKSRNQWRSDFADTALPAVWKAATLDYLNLDPVMRSPKPTPGAYQIVAREGVEQDANGNWVERYVLRDMFQDTTDEDGVLITKAEHEAAYQARLDADAAENNRSTRNKLLSESDWTQMNDSPLSNEDKTAWATYRQELRDVSDLAAWPQLSPEDWPVSP